MFVLAPVDLHELNIADPKTRESERAQVRSLLFISGLSGCVCVESVFVNIIITRINLSSNKYPNITSCKPLHFRRKESLCYRIRLIINAFKAKTKEPQEFFLIT